MVEYGSSVTISGLTTLTCIIHEVRRKSRHRLAQQARWQFTRKKVCLREVRLRAGV